jgi:hypothetical protein
LIKADIDGNCKGIIKINTKLNFCDNFVVELKFKNNPRCFQRHHIVKIMYLNLIETVNNVRF